MRLKSISLLSWCMLGGFPHRMLQHLNVIVCHVVYCCDSCLYFKAPEKCVEPSGVVSLYIWMYCTYKLVYNRWDLLYISLFISMWWYKCTCQPRSPLRLVTDTHKHLRSRPWGQILEFYTFSCCCERVRSSQSPVAFFPIFQNLFMSEHSNETMSVSQITVNRLPGEN